MALLGLTRAQTAERTAMSPDTINETICQALRHLTSRLSAEAATGCTMSKRMGPEQRKTVR